MTGNTRCYALSNSQCEQLSTHVLCMLAAARVGRRTWHKCMQHLSTEAYPYRSINSPVSSNDAVMLNLQNWDLARLAHSVKVCRPSDSKQAHGLMPGLTLHSGVLLNGLLSGLESPQQCQKGC